MASREAHWTIGQGNSGSAHWPDPKVIQFLFLYLLLTKRPNSRGTIDLCPPRIGGVIKRDVTRNDLFSDWDINREADLHQSFVFLYQAGFYIHRTYASWFEDEWRKDSPVLMAHHIFTFMLLSTGYIYRCFIYRVDDVINAFLLSDIIIVASLCCFFTIWMMFCSQRQKFVIIWLIKKEIIFGRFYRGSYSRCSSSYGKRIAFSLRWRHQIFRYLFRLHWFPLLLLHTTINLAKIIYNGRYPPMFFFNNSLLMLLLFMHFYWFKVQMS